MTRVGRKTSIDRDKFPSTGWKEKMQLSMFNGSENTPSKLGYSLNNIIQEQFDYFTKFTKVK